MASESFVSCVPTPIRVEQMQVIRNLIEVKVDEQQMSRANFTDGLEIQVKSSKPFTVNAFWIVKIRDIHLEIEKDWKTIRDELWQDKFLIDKQKSLCQSKQQIYHETHEVVNCRVKPPQEIDTDQFASVKPRDFYPLVIIVTCYEEEPRPQAADAAANIHIIHIRDSDVPIKSHVIKQYIKQIDGRILDISPLFPEETSTCFICFEEANKEEDLRLFCLLPCRHSPICSTCLTRIRECPKCRCPIASVFDINAPTAESCLQKASGERPTIDPSLRHLYDDADSDPPSGENRAANRRRGGGGGGGRGGQQQGGGFIASIKSLFGF